MFYLTAGFLLFSFALTYRNLRYTSTWFLQGVVIGWIVSILGLILYMSKQNYYFTTIASIFPLGKGIWNWLIRNNIPFEHIIRLLNFGIILFVFSIFGLSLFLLHREQRERIQKVGLISVSLVLLTEFIVFDPIVQKSILFTGVRTNIIPPMFRWINIVILLLSLLLLLNSILRYPKIRFLQNYTLYFSMIIIPIVLIFFFLFAWLPDILLKRTLIPGYYVNVVPDLSRNIVMFQWLPYLMFIALASILTALYKYRAVDAYYKQRDIHINRSITTAGLGIRAFAHGIKNHLLSIRAEAEMMKSSPPTKESAYQTSTRMIDSCNAALETINNAAVRLRDISLDLHSVLLDVPVKKAMEKMQQSARFNLYVTGEVPRAFIDEAHMTESIINILQNAVDAVRTEGDKSALITIEISSHESWGIISISDNGPGLDEAQIDSLFSPFFSTKSSIQNWGIGLSFCHRIISAHGGKIEGMNSPEGGAVFKIYLPML